MGEIGRAFTNSMNQQAAQSVGQSSGQATGSSLWAGQDPGVMDPEAPPLPSPYSNSSEAPVVTPVDQSQSQSVPVQEYDPGQVFAASPQPAASDIYDDVYANAPDLPEPEKEAPEPSSYAPQVSPDGQWKDGAAWQEDSEENPEEGPTIEGLKPGHRNILGKALDFLFQITGNRPVYELNMQEMDARRAMRGYARDPEQTARQILTVNGPAGAKMFDHVEDRRNKERARIGQSEGVMRQMFYAANPETWDAMRASAGRYAKAQGIPDEYLPETLEEAKAYAEGGYQISDRMEDASKDRYRQGQVGASQQRADAYTSRVSAQNSNDGRRTDIYERDVDSKVGERSAGTAMGESGKISNLPPTKGVVEGALKTSKDGKTTIVFRDGKWIPYN